MLMLMTRWDFPTTTKRNIACSAFKVKTCKFSEHFSTEWTGMEGDGQNTDPQSMDYPNGLLKWTTLKWTTLKNYPNEYYLMFLTASIIKLHITSAYVHPVQHLKPP